jgi:hypothetical protein
VAFARDNLASRSLYLDCGGQTYQGPIFDSKEAAEQHGLELCKDWIGRSVNVSAFAFIIRLPMVGGPMRNQPPIHEPALVAALVMDNDGNVGGSLGGYVKVGVCTAVDRGQGSTGPNVAKLKRSCEAATHKESPYSGRSKSAGCSFSFHRVVFQSVLL